MFIRNGYAPRQLRRRHLPDFCHKSIVGGVFLLVSIRRQKQFNMRLSSGCFYGNTSKTVSTDGLRLMETAYFPALKLPAHSHESAYLLKDFKIQNTYAQPVTFANLLCDSHFGRREIDGRNDGIIESRVNSRIRNEFHSQGSGGENKLRQRRTRANYPSHSPLERRGNARQKD